MRDPFARKVGTYIDGDDVVTVTITPRLEFQRNDAGSETVDHATLEGPVLRFSVMGATRVGRSEGSAGQIVDELSKVTSFAPGWDAERRDRAVELWNRWHLNDVKAGCAHQTVVWEDSDYGRRPSLDLTEPCPESGYRYGSAWLTEPISAEVEAELRDVFGVPA
jgi:hypothetical protein